MICDIESIISELYDELVFEMCDGRQESAVLDVVHGANYSTLCMVANAIPHIGARSTLIDLWIQYVEDVEKDDMVSVSEVELAKVARAGLERASKQHQVKAKDQAILERYVYKLYHYGDVDREEFCEDVVAGCDLESFSERAPLVNIPKSRKRTREQHSQDGARVVMVRAHRRIVRAKREVHSEPETECEDKLQQRIDFWFESTGVKKG